MGIQEYRVKDYTRAERIEEDGTVFTAVGPVWGRAGDYLVHTDTFGVSYAEREVFESIYELVPDDISEARKFTPNGKTVDQVVAFLRDNPDEVGRVKQLERDGGSRKGIIEYEV